MKPNKKEVPKKIIKKEVITLEQATKNMRNNLRTLGITGMDSVNHCLTFITNRFLDFNICNKIGIPPEVSFKSIIKIVTDNENIKSKDEKVVNGIYEKMYEKFVSFDENTESFYKYFKRNFNFMNIQFQRDKFSPRDCFSMLKSLKNLDVNTLDNTFDVVGTIYESHLGTGSSSPRDLGQFFTNRQVIKYMVNLCDPKINETICDPTMGTGGFLTMAIKYLNKHNKNIDWNENKKYIYGFDIDERVKNMGSLNLILETGQIFNDTVICRDTLYKDVMINDKKLSFDVILANEPMGVKNLDYEKCCERIKKLNIKGKKGEVLFLQLFMKSLNKNGRCAVVVPDGLLFNNAVFFRNTRKYLIENFKLKKIISMNDDFFSNTGVSTSILYFENSGKTDNIDFCEIKFTSEKHDNIAETKILTAKYDEIVDKKYTLSVKRYIKPIEINYNDAVKMKLGDICDFLSTTKYKSSMGKTTGKYRFYNSSQDDKLYLDTFDIDIESIIIGNGGNLCIHYDTKFTASKHVTVCQLKEKKKFMLKYIYYYILLNKKILTDLSEGTGIEWLNKTNLRNVEIPIPSIEIQKIIADKLDILTENNKTNIKMIEELRSIMKTYVNMKTFRTEKKKIGDICETHAGEYIKKSDFIKGEYPVYGGGDISNYINKANRENDFIISKDGVSKDCVRYIKEKFFLNHHGWTLTIINKNVSKMYLYYYFYNNQEKIFNSAEGSAQAGVSQEIFYDLEIPIPSEELQDEIIKYCDTIQNDINIINNRINENDILKKNTFSTYLDTKN